MALMPTPITMPQLGESVTEGTVVRWLKREGDTVERDEPLLEITTDKVNADMPSPVSGVLVRLLVEEGAVVPVGAAVAQIDETGHASGTATPSEATPAQPERAAVSAQAPAPAAFAHNVAADGDHQERRRYSPVVRKLAAEHGLSLDTLTGTGLGGRITKDDVLAFIARADAPGLLEVGPGTQAVAEKVTKAAVLAYATSSAAQTEQPTQPIVPQAEQVAVDQPPVHRPTQASSPEPAAATLPVMPAAGEEYVPLTPMRRGIAEHMVRSKHTAPHATTVTEVDMTRIVRWRAANKNGVRAREGADITYVAFVVQAVVSALRKFPYLNSAWGGDGIVLKKQINIGIAVGMDDGLLVPVIHRADERSLVGIARAISDLAERARARKLALNELQGGTFTVNNTGVFGSIVSTPVINQPQAAILSMEAIVKRPVVVEHDAIAIRSMMNICLSFDHRIVDGLMAGGFAQHVKHSLEQFALPSEG